MTNEELFEQHKDVLTGAAGRNGWRTMPPGGPEAIETSLVVESDPTWMYSDDYRASNGFTLTPLGRKIMVHHGFVCTCAGCAHTRFEPAITDQKYCSSCQAGISQYGSVEIAEGTSCKFHARMLEEQQTTV